MGPSQDKFIFSFENHKAVYFRVPKAASSSILITLRKSDNIEKIDYADVNKENFKFTFVRNPFDRLASAHRHLIQRANVGTVYNNPGVYKNMPFEEFVEVIGKIPIEKLDIHYRPQWTFIPDKPDFIGKFENLQADFDKACEKIGMPKQTLIWENATDRTDFKKYYNNVILQKAIIVYKKDFELFGYSKKLNT